MLHFTTMPPFALLFASLILMGGTLSSCAICRDKICNPALDFVIYKIEHLQGTESGFDYSDGFLGPNNWGNLRPEWRICGTGTSQSPVDINTTDLHLEQNRLKFNYTGGSAELHLNDHNVELVWIEDGDSVYWDDEEFNVVNLHWHTPNEHTIDGAGFPLEAHIVHMGPDSKLLVVALLYTRGEEDEFLAEVIKEFPSLNDTERVDHEVGNVSLNSIEFGEEYYHYMGSLTTPPCTEGVTWIIMQKQHSVSKEQVDALVQVEKGKNARPLQPLNGRIIYEYK